jgi:hypothetical protein
MSLAEGTFIELAWPVIIEIGAWAELHQTTKSDEYQSAFHARLSVPKKTTRSHSRSGSCVRGNSSFSDRP